MKLPALIIYGLLAGMLVSATAPRGEAAPAGPGGEPVVFLWPQGAPGSELKKDLPEKLDGQNLSQVHNPSLTVFLPAAATATGSAVIVLPGGGHRYLVMEKEGYTPARWLAAHGVAAFVLKYRLAREPGSTYRVEVEGLADTQRAMRVVRARAAEWGVDPRRVGVMGFSAGGELAALVSLRFDHGRAHADDPVEREDCKPAFQALIYPGGSTSIVPTAESPPAFLACGNDDRPDISSGVPQVYLRFKQVKVPAELLVFSGVGHGFGLNPGPAASWPDRFNEWLARLGAAGAPPHS